jgi:opacity protein-like surface antigen
MKKIALAMTVSVMALAAPAVAADGFYMGIGASYNSNEHDVRQNVPLGAPFWFNVTNRASINNAPANDVSSDVYGAQILAGYKTHVATQVVLGLEVDASAFDGEVIDFHTQPYDALGTFTLQQHLSQQWMSTIRAKLGFDVTPEATLFVTAGLAVSDVELRTTFSDTYAVVAQRIPAQSAVNSELKTGLVYGGGLDWAMGGSTSLRVEYLRADLGEISNSRALTFTGGVPANEVLNSKAQLQSNSIRVGLVWDLNL